MCRRKSELRALPMNTTSVCRGTVVPERGRDSVRNGQKWGRAVGSAQCQHYLAKQLQPIADAISPIESFWGRLKNACVHGQRFATREVIMNWMAFYNHRRLHSSLGYLSPMQYEKRWYEAQRKKAV